MFILLSFYNSIKYCGNKNPSQLFLLLYSFNYLIFFIEYSINSKILYDYYI